MRENAKIPSLSMPNSFLTNGCSGPKQTERILSALPAHDFASFIRPRSKFDIPRALRWAPNLESKGLFSQMVSKARRISLHTCSAASAFS